MVRRHRERVPGIVRKVGDKKNSSLVLSTFGLRYHVFVNWTMSLDDVIDADLDYGIQGGVRWGGSEEGAVSSANNETLGIA